MVAIKNNSQEITEKDWLRSYYNNVEETELTSILYFTLIWNVFEKECCGNEAKVNDDAPALAEHYGGKLKGSLANTWSYFRGRYVQNNGEMSRSFESFKFNRNDNKPWVSAILRLNEDASAAEKLEALLRIAFRLRNNLYHGEKNIRTLSEQNENFRHMNQLLMNLIDTQNGRLDK